MARLRPVASCGQERVAHARCAIGRRLVGSVVQHAARGGDAVAHGTAEQGVDIAIAGDPGRTASLAAAHPHRTPGSSATAPARQGFRSLAPLERARCRIPGRQPMARSRSRRERSAPEPPRLSGWLSRWAADRWTVPDQVPSSSSLPSTTVAYDNILRDAVLLSNTTFCLPAVCLSTKLQVRRQRSDHPAQVAMHADFWLVINPL